MEMLKNNVVWIYRSLVLAVLVYIASELRTIQQMSNVNKQEINYVNSKLDYVTSDINQWQIKE